MTGKVAKLSNYPNGFDGGLTLYGVPTLASHTGKVFWVGASATATAYPNRKGGSDGNKGTFLSPFATIDYAIGQCLANRGDIIMVMPGHAETLSAAITVDVAGVSIIGQGNGTARPALTGGVAADLISVTADNVTIANLYFNEKTTASATSATIDVAAANCRLLGNHFDLGTNEVLNITATAAAENLSVIGNEFFVTADGSDNALQIEGVVDHPYIVDNKFITSVANFDDGAAVSFESQAITNAYLANNIVIGGGSVLTGGASAVGTYLDEDASGKAKEVTMVDSVADEHDAAFTIDGTVKLHGLYGICTTDGDGTEDIVIATEGGTTLWATAEIHAMNAGDIVSAAEVGAAPAVSAAAAHEGLSMWETPVVITGAEAVLDLTTSGSGGGLQTLIAIWEPVSSGAEVISSKA